MSPKILIPFLLLVMALAACSGETPSGPVTDPDILVAFELNKYFMRTFADQGTVFASNPEGNVLDVATWDGPTTVVLKNTDVHPDTISFTFVKSDDWELVLASEVGVPAGTTWTYTGTFFPINLGNAQIEFFSVPPHDGFRVSYNWTSHTGSTLPNQRSIEVCGVDPDCFIRIDPLEGPPVGGWMSGLISNHTFHFDFDRPDQAKPLTPALIQLPPGGDRLSFSVSRFDTLIGNRFNILLDGGSFQEMIPRSVTVHTPEIDPAKLRTHFTRYTDGNPVSLYSQDTSGPLPGEFSLMEGDLTVTSTSPDSLIFTTTSDWDRFTALWSQDQELYATWFVEGDAPVTEFALPRLPREIAEQIPEYPPQGFVLKMLTIIRDEVDGGTLTQGKIFPSAGLGGRVPGEDLEKAPRGAFVRVFQH